MTIQEFACELEALKCEMQAMIWENEWKKFYNETIAYNETNFNILAEKFRELGKRSFSGVLR